MAPTPTLADDGEGEYVALMSTGAYGFVMASNYNSRPLPAEVMVKGKQAALVRERQPAREIGEEKEFRAGSDSPYKPKCLSRKNLMPAEAGSTT